MKPIVLKVPPERVAQIAAAIERDLEQNPANQHITDLPQILSWLRYRLDRATARANAASKQ